MQFTDLRFPLGTRMQLNITGHDYKPMTLPAQLLGYRSGFTLLVYLAKKPIVPVQRDAKVSVRAGLQSAIIQFYSVVEYIFEAPYFHLHLKYPDAIVVEQQLRRCPRFELDAPVSATIASQPDDAINGRIVDISLNGARVVFYQKLPAEEITLTSTIFVVGSQQQLSVKATIKHIPTASTDDSMATFVYGASFIDISATQKLLLQALCYELQSTEES